MTGYAPEHDRFDQADTNGPLPLEGVKVLDVGNLVAAPFATNLLADFGADVIKIEHPEYGDGLRELAPHKDDVPLWWKVTDRNKRAITLNLSKPEGAAVFKDLAEKADVIVENFRPTTMEGWGLGYDDLAEINPGIVMLRISGFGQTGPYSERPGFGRIAGAISGLTTLIGDPDGPPMSPGYPVADGITGIYGAFSVMIALYYRDALDGEGQEIDLALNEAVFRMLEYYAIEYDQLQEVRKRTGNQHAYVAPSSTYKTSDSEYVTMAASTQSVWRRLCKAMDREDLLDKPRFEDNRSRVEHADEVNGIVADWVAEHTREEVEERFEEYGVAFQFVYDIQDIFNDEHYRERDALVNVEDEELGEAVVQGVVPKFSKTPGRIDHLGPKKGEYNQDVLGSELGYSKEKLSKLRENDII